MKYELELTTIIETMRADSVADPKWRNKLISRLEEVQAMSHMLYGRIGSSTSPTDYDGHGYTVSGEMPDPIPDSLREFSHGVTTEPL